MLAKLKFPSDKEQGPGFYLKLSDAIRGHVKRKAVIALHAARARL